MDDSKVFYNLRWKAGFMTDLAKDIALVSAKSGVEMGLLYLVTGGIGLLSGAAIGKQTYSSISKVFSSQKAIAKKTGQMLAYALILGYPFRN